MKLIIHADDFGMARSINEACVELCSLKTLSSVSVMANMPYSTEVRTLLPLKHVSLGLHSTFTQGRPILPPENIPSLVRENGEFHDYKEILRKAKRRELKVDEIISELKAQHQVLRNIIGERLIFIDSHHSIHNKLAPFRDAFLKFGYEKSCSAAIRTRQMCYLDECGNATKLVAPGAQTILRFGPRKVLANYYYRRTAAQFKKTYQIADGMIVEDSLGALNVFKLLPKLDMSGKAGKTYYAVSHPATTAEDLPDSNLKEERVAEYNFLKSDAFRAFVEQYPLSNFGNLGQV